MNMNKKMVMILLLTFLFIFDISIVPFAQAGFQQDSGADGIVSMEAESFTSNVAGAGDYTAYSWIELADAEASGGDYMVAAPDDENNAGETTDSPHINFTVDFTKTGTHYVWVRAKTPTTNDDSCFLGYNGTIFDKWRMGKSTNWTWKKCDDTFTATPGEQTFSIYMREAGTEIDKIVLTVSSSYTPTGEGPPESGLSISGEVTSDGSALSGVEMTGLPGNPVTDAGGNYHAIMSSVWSATVTPTKTGYSFTPLNRVYSNVTTPLSDQDYAATVISGVVTYGGFALGGVEMTGLPGNPVTDDSGYYNAPVPYDWSGTVTPIKTNYNFTPLSSDYNNITTPQIDQDYTATTTYDLNSDLVTDISDFWELVSAWLTTGEGTFANINKVNDVDLEDFALFAGVIGEDIPVSYTGQVTGVSYMPVENAVVTISGIPQPATTDPNGYFSISGDATSQVIEVSAPGYITETFFQINTANDTLHFVIDLAAPLVTYGDLAGSSPDIYLKKVWDYADAMMASGKDTYGAQHTPLFASVLDFSPIEVPTNMPSTISDIRSHDRVLSGGNPMHDENLYRILYALSHISTDNSYANDADASLLWFWNNTQSVNTGLYPWGEHASWNFYNERRNTNTGSSNSHEYFRPWILWEPWLRQSPATFSAFAMGVWDHQISNQTTGQFSRHANIDSHGPDVGHEYPRHGGFYIHTWAKAYQQTKDPTFLTAIEVIVDYYRSIQHVTTRAIPSGWADAERREKEWTYSCVSLAIDLKIARGMIPVGTLSDKMALMEQEIDTRFHSLAHELDDPLYPGTQGTVSTAWVDSTNPYTPDRPYRDWWGQGYGNGNVADVLNRCYERYLQTGSTDYENMIIAGANYYLSSNLPGGTTYPIVLAEVIKLSVNAYRITSDVAYLNRAKYFADQAIVLFWDSGTIPLPKSTSDHDHYETITNGDSLALSLLELWMEINHPELDWQFHHIDR